jgi:hypothetical protein
MLLLACKPTSRLSLLLACEKVMSNANPTKIPAIQGVLL